MADHTGVRFTRVLAAVQWLDLAGHRSPKRSTSPSNAKWLLTILVQRADWSTWVVKGLSAPALETVSDLSVGTIGRAIAMLERAGYIERLPSSTGGSWDTLICVADVVADGEARKAAARASVSAPDVVPVGDRTDDPDHSDHPDPCDDPDQADLEGDHSDQGGDHSDQGGDHSDHRFCIYQSFSVPEPSGSPPTPPLGGEGPDPPQEDTSVDPHAPDHTAALREAWNAYADDLYPGQRSQQWDEGVLFLSPKQARRQAQMLEHGPWLSQMFERYVEACELGVYTFSQDDFSGKTRLNALRQWAERGIEPTPVKIQRRQTSQEEGRGGRRTYGSSAPAAADPSQDAGGLTLAERQADWDAWNEAGFKCGPRPVA